MILEGIQQAGTGNNDASQGTVTSPTGLAVNDLIFTFLDLRGGMSSGNITAPDGYLFKEQIHGAGTWHANINVYYKIAEQADVDAANITFSWTSDRRWRLATGRIAAGDFDPNDIFGNTVSADDATGVTSFTLSSMNVTGDNLVIGVFGVSDTGNNQQSTVDPAIFTTEHVNIDAGSTAGIVLNVSSYTPSADGTTGSMEWTWTNAGNPAATAFEVNASDDFGITSPLDQATGVSDPFDLQVSNPNVAQGFYKQISETAPPGGDLSALVKDIVSTSVSTSISGLNGSTTHYLKAIELTTLGGQSTEAVFSDSFNRADDLTGWGADYDSMVNSGAASKFIESNTGVIEIDPSSRFLIDVLSSSVEDFDATWEFENENVSTDYQPTLHFSTQGDWSAGGRIHSYWVWLNGGDINLGRTSASYSNSVFQTEAFARTINTKYKVRVLKEGFRLRVAIWASSGSQNGWIIDYTDTSEVSSQGTLAIDIATVSSTADERMTFYLIEYELAAEAPQITNVDVTDESASITFSTVPFDNEGYEYQYREVGGSFGSWVNISYVNPFEFNLSLGDYEIQMSAMHNGQRSPVSDIVSFTIAEPAVSNMVISPSSPTLSEEENATTTLTRTLDSEGGASKATTWSITQQPSNGSISIQSQTDSECVIKAGAGLVVGNSWQAKATSDFNDTVFATVTGSVVEGLNLDIEDTNAADRQTLALIYQATGADWEAQKTHFKPDNNDFYTHTGDATGWSTDPDQIDLSSGNEPFGVETEQINGEDRVVSLKLNAAVDVGWDIVHRKSKNGEQGGNNLTGTITPEFNWQLFRCKYINLKQNYIDLQIPRKIYTPHLEVLNLNGTNEDMVPETPPNISNKINWVQRSNRIHGELHKEIGNATNLEIIQARGRFWGEGDEETGSSDVFPVDQYALGGDIPDEIQLTKLAIFDTYIHKFTSFPADFPDTMEWFFFFQSVINPATGNRFSQGIGVSKLSFLEGRPNLERVFFDRLDLGVGTTDKGPLPDLSESTSIRDLQFGFNGIEAAIPSHYVDGTSTFVAEVNPIQGPLPEAGGRFGRSTIRLTNCGIGGTFPESWPDAGTTQLSIGGNGFTNNMDSLSSGWTSFYRIRNIELNNNNFSGGLPILDWFSHSRQNTSHGLSKFSRIRVSGSGLNLSASQPKKPWEISQKERRWYYDNKNNIIDNVSGSYTLGDALSDGYSESFIDATLGTTSWNNSDPIKGSGRFMNRILDKIYSGWLAKDF